MILREKMNKIKEQKSKQQDSINQNKISTSEIGALSFEDCLKKVEALSVELESGGLVLNDALHKYKLAMAIMDRASTLLMAAKDEIQVIDNNGEEIFSDIVFLLCKKPQHVNFEGRTRKHFALVLN